MQTGRGLSVSPDGQVILYTRTDTTRRTRREIMVADGFRRGKAGAGKIGNSDCEWITPLPVASTFFAQRSPVGICTNRKLGPPYE